VDVLVEGPADPSDGVPDGVVGRAAHQGPDVDGVTVLPGVTAVPGTMLAARVVGSAGVDLVAEPVERALVGADAAGAAGGAG
jgi:ribosomal protein S12 methylthiotransferase